MKTITGKNLTSLALGLVFFWTACGVSLAAKLDSTGWQVQTPTAFNALLPPTSLQLAVTGAATPPEVISGTLADGVSAFLITLAMAFGLILPKVCIERFTRH